MSVNLLTQSKRELIIIGRVLISLYYIQSGTNFIFSNSTVSLTASAVVVDEFRGAGIRLLHFYESRCDYDG